ncbi:response regulator [Sphingomonas sp. PAMC 26621]|uniref:response regulator n=1 Tax=Sphingomonas sp. PAMC 26621 TaxID=1112213 RepID=UPI000288E5E5|nr:response regulator [Sphingomonas sp. PAMC 26621]
MTELQRQILVVDDEFIIVLGLIDQVEEMGLTVCGSASTADEAIALAREHRPMVVLMDMRLDGTKDGVDAALIIHEEIGSKVIFITGSQEPDSLARIHSDHPHAILFKPVSNRRLCDTITAAMQMSDV